MILKLGSKGEEVKLIQEFLGITVDGDFGPMTESAVVAWQNANGLIGDGEVGPKTMNAIGLLSTDLSETLIQTNPSLMIHKHFLPRGEYKQGPTDKEYLFLHHTAGWNNPYRCIDHWGRDSRGAIGTEFVIGGQSIKGNDDKHDGVVLQAFPDGSYAWHLGKNGSQRMHTQSVGIEVCNFGYLTNGKTYAGTTADKSQIVTLDKEFRGYKDWHRYSDKQIEALRQLILHIADRDNIDVREGLPKWIKDKGANAFEFSSDAYYGKVKGLLTHTNTRKDKFDMFPQQELLDMLVSL